LSTTITKDGLETALSNLQYRNAKQPKTRLIEAIRSFYRIENALETVTEINSDHLIRLVWELDDNPALIKSKRKNLNSIKSTINNDLMNLFHENKNPEGIIIGPLNTFIMSDAAKERLLSSFADSARSQGNLPLEKIADVLSVISEFMSGIEKISTENPKEQVQKILDLIKGMAEKAGSGDTAGTDFPQKMNNGSTLSEGEGTGEMIKDGIENSILDQIEALEEIDEDEIEEIEETELEEIDEDADIEEVDDIDLEEVEEDEISEIEDAAAEEIEDTELEEIDGDEVVTEEMDDIDLEAVEEIDEDEIEEIEDTELEEIDGDGTIDKTSAFDQLGLPRDNLEQKEFQTDKNLLAEQFDGVLGSMERYYNQYLLIPGGQYIIGCDHQCIVRGICRKNRLSDNCREIWVWMGIFRPVSEKC